MAFRRPAPEPSHLELVGFCDQAAYDDREPTWQPTDFPLDAEEAIAAARQWISQTGPTATVEVQEVIGREAWVRSVVTAGGVEQIGS